MKKMTTVFNNDADITFKIQITSDATWANLKQHIN